jgi:Inositol hexakisphosphate
MKKLLIPFLMTMFVLAPFFSDPLVAALPTLYPIFDSKEETDLNVRFDELKVSKGGQFSERGFIELVDSLPLESDQLIIFDLRDDCHGFINGMPVYWKDKCHCCEYKHLKEAMEIGHTWIEEKDQISGLELAISQAITEQELVESLGHHYVRIPMADGDLPDDLFMDQFVQFIDKVSPNHWIHFHGRTGGEKASTFLVLLDIIKNARQMNLEEILTGHELISEMDLAELRSEEERLDYIQQKLDFISEFYAYSKEVSDFSTPWSKWVSQKPSFSIRTDKRHRSSSLIKDIFCSHTVRYCIKYRADGTCEQEVSYDYDNGENHLGGKYRWNNRGDRELEFEGSDRRNKRGNGG